RGSRVDRDAPEAGADLRYDLELALEEAATSVEKTIEIERLETCPRCFGTGAERGSAPERCPTCGGRGEVQHSQRTIFGSFTQVSTCPSCGGTGTVLRHPCTQCRGSGRAAAQPGTVITVKGKGMPDARGNRGDLHVRLDVRVPTDLTDEERALLRQLAALRGRQLKPHRRKISDKVKDMLQ